MSDAAKHLEAIDGAALEKRAAAKGIAIPNALSIFNARMVAEELHETQFTLIPSMIAPSVEEGVGISFMNNEKRAIIECYNTGQILLGLSNARAMEVLPINSDKKEIHGALARVYEFLNS